MTPLLLVALIVLGILAVLSAVLLAFTYTMARRLLRPIRSPRKCLPADVGLEMEPVRIPGPRGVLTGWYLPAKNGCTLICCHGINDNASQWLPQVARLHTRNGYGALLFDFTGHGESAGREVTYGIRERHDVEAVLEYLRGRGDVEMERLAILGYSLGAITAVLAAAAIPELRVVVIESGFSDLYHDIARVFTRYTGLPAFPFANLVIFWGQRIARVQLSEIRPAQVIGNIAPRPVLIISDLRDALADEPHDGELLFSSAGEPKELWQVAEATHVAAFNAEPDEWIERVESFLNIHLANAIESTSSQQR